MTLHYPDWWDQSSDQPYQLSLAEKQRTTGSHAIEYSKTALTAFAILPFLLLRLSLQRTVLLRDDSTPTNFVGLGVSPDRGDPNAIVDLVEELGVKHLLLRVPTWQVDQLDEYLEFAARFSGKNILVNILQSRDNVNDPNSWAFAVETIITAFWKLTQEFQLGNAINRSKWGCRHVGDYLALLDATVHLRERFPGIVLSGSSVIDFEPLPMLRTLVNFHSYHLDACTTLLYVNRRGSPFNHQFGIFDLKNKIRTLAALLSLSNRSGRRLWITETNWPLLNTKPFTPNSGNPRSTVNEETQAKYLTDYYRIAWQTGLVERIYWWQLIQPGYGLVDHRSQALRKMPSYFAFKDLLSLDHLNMA